MVYTLFDILPNVTRTVNTVLLDTQLRAFLKKSSTLGGIEINLTADAINEMISGISFPINIGKVSIPVSLKPIN